MQDKIIAAITLYLASEMHVRALADSTIFITSKKFDSGIDAIKSTATEIAAAIAPLVEEGEPDWKDAPVWGNYRTEIDGDVYFFEDIFLPCRYMKWGDEIGSHGVFYLQVVNRNWSGEIRKRPK